MVITTGREKILVHKSIDYIALERNNHIIYVEKTEIPELIEELKEYLENDIKNKSNFFFLINFYSHVIYKFKKTTNQESEKIKV